jgi:hypothetical protein
MATESEVGPVVAVLVVAVLVGHFPWVYTCSWLVARPTAQSQPHSPCPTAALPRDQLSIVLLELLKCVPDTSVGGCLLTHNRAMMLQHLPNWDQAGCCTKDSYHTRWLESFQQPTARNSWETGASRSHHPPTQLSAPMEYPRNMQERYCSRPKAFPLQETCTQTPCVTAPKTHIQTSS